ncbi:MAG: rhodanese-like domain-containing protein [Leptospiraceae bacterium]|nr:rhodanese-like domain-containing protein [Leptospiraceae bacterium]MDW8306877.1 rhodanese-like domain-containing protein [Leptospiraceae bacterium]
MVDSLSPRDLQGRLEAGEDLLLLDIRSKEEYDICHIHPSLLIPIEELYHRYEELPRDKDIVVICHYGTKSEAAVFFLRRQGFRAYSLKGGINMWACTVEPDMAQY